MENIENILNSKLEEPKNENEGDKPSPSENNKP